MDRIWDRKSFEVGGHWPLWRDETKWPRRTDKSNAKRNIIKLYIYLMVVPIWSYIIHNLTTFNMVSPPPDICSIFWSIQIVVCLLFIYIYIYIY